MHYSLYFKAAIYNDNKSGPCITLVLVLGKSHISQIYVMEIMQQTFGIHRFLHLSFIVFKPTVSKVCVIVDRIIFWFSMHFYFNQKHMVVFMENIGCGMAAQSKSAVGLIWLGRWLE